MVLWEYFDEQGESVKKDKVVQGRVNRIATILRA
jgi:hypothetical protein